MRRTGQMLVLLATACLTGAPALAAGPAGDWRGVLQTRNGRTDIAIEVRPAPGGYRGTFGDMTHQVWRIPLAPVRGGQPAFRIQGPAGTFLFSWNRAAGTWRGVWRDRTGAYGLDLERGRIPAAPLLTRGDKVILTAAAALMLLEAGGIARLLQLRRRRRPRTAACA